MHLPSRHLHEETIRVNGAIIIDESYEVVLLGKFGNSVRLGIRSLASNATPAIRRLSPRPPDVRRRAARFLRLTAKPSSN